MNLVWKLLRRHISVPQFAGFFFANLLGMLIVLLGYQFYRDVLPVFTQGDSFMRPGYIVISKRIGTGSTIMGSTNTFSDSDIENVARQSFARRVGQFTSTGYKVSACMGVTGMPVLSSEIFLESVPDEFIDIPLKDWTWHEGAKDIPIILPRTYINMYNFGFARTRSLPKISDGLVGMIDLRLSVAGNGRQDEYRGRVVGFSSRLNTILVPQSFMEWSNSAYSGANEIRPARLIVEVTSPADGRIAEFVEDNGLEVENGKLDAEKTAYFLKMTVAIVMSIGVVISVLSFYILMLSIYLLVQKNSSKLENLLLIGYSPQRVAMPYQALAAMLNALVLAIACAAVYVMRGLYMPVIETLYPAIGEGGPLPSVILGLLLFAVVTMVNVFVIRGKVMNSIWKHKE